MLLALALLTLHVEVVAVADGRLEEHSDGVGELGVALIGESGQREVLVSAVVDSEVADLGLGESVVSGLNHCARNFCVESKLSYLTKSKEFKILIKIRSDMPN